MSMQKLTTILIALPFLVMFGMFGIIGLHQIGEQYIIEDISNTTQTIANDLNLSPVYAAKIAETEQNFKNVVLPYDLFFIMISIFAFGSAAVIAYKAEPLPKYNFLGVITIGLLIFMVIVFFINQFASYWINNFFYLIFDDFTQSTPYLDWFFANLSMILIIGFIVLLLLLQIKGKISNFINSDNSDGLGGQIRE